MDHLFLSDVHLGAFLPDRNRQIEDDLISLIQYCGRNKIHIHLLGDLFDYWMEYPDVIPSLGDRVLKEFSKYNRETVPATYITGNHDNWTLGYFEKLGFDVFYDFRVLKFHDLEFFLHHGDGLSDRSMALPRPLFHRLLRHRGFTAVYRKIFNADAGLNLMRWFSGLSRSHPQQKPERLDKWSESFLKTTNYDLVISGHDHIPRVETFPFGTYINLGTFYQHKTVAFYTNGHVTLVEWDAADKKFKTINTLYQSTDNE